MAARSPSPVLAVEEVACERGGRRLFSALSFALAAGEALVLEGANGSGKSSLLRLLAGVKQSSYGRVMLDFFLFKNDEKARRAELRTVRWLKDRVRDFSYLRGDLSCHASSMKDDNIFYTVQRIVSCDDAPRRTAVNSRGESRDVDGILFKWWQKDLLKYQRNTGLTVPMSKLLVFMTRDYHESDIRPNCELPDDFEDPIYLGHDWRTN